MDIPDKVPLQVTDRRYCLVYKFPSPSILAPPIVNSHYPIGVGVVEVGEMYLRATVTFFLVCSKCQLQWDEDLSNISV